MQPDENEKLFEITVEELDIPDHIFEEATLRYEEVGEFLAAADSDLAKYSPQVYTQGSFRLGTVIQPIDREDEYDIDLVCVLDLKKESIAQADLKTVVGDRLKKHAELKALLKASRRCWTLNYPDQPGKPGFHMDILPSIPNQVRLPTGILLTDTELVRWQTSNPIAYAEWFKSRMKIQFDQRRNVLAKSLNESVENVPEWRVKTPLQRAIQLLKRHRDVRFLKKNADLKPTSIIISTLAAHAYRGEADIYQALSGITARMAEYIERKDGKWWIQNPVDIQENFADKWNENIVKYSEFLDWLAAARKLFSSIPMAKSMEEGLTMFSESIGQKTEYRVANRLGLKKQTTWPVPAHKVPIIPDLGDTRHVQNVNLPFLNINSVTISAGIYHKTSSGGKGRFLWPYTQTSGSAPKNVWIKFTAKTNTIAPYQVKWQVVNTGDEAIKARQLRGDMQRETGIELWESTAYLGTHWVEAFVLKEGVCVARSGRFLVKVR